MPHSEQVYFDLSLPVVTRPGFLLFFVLPSMMDKLMSALPTSLGYSGGVRGYSGVLEHGGSLFGQVLLLLLLLGVVM